MISKRQLIVQALHDVKIKLDKIKVYWLRTS